ncbi:MAG: acetyltransferase, family [Paenibacillus sp.]|jgi:RimJ/RimL family protein N-acetyltransferase|nr:acetyltransferase, family [Paenibacillus sp.]
MLEGQRISLRCLEVEDLPLIAAWRNQSEIRRSFFNKALLAASGQKKWFERIIEDRSKQFFVGVSKDSNLPFGMISLVDIDLANQKAEIGTTIVGDQSMWGKGIASEMIALLLEYAFVDLGLNRVYAYAIDYNKGSIRVKEKGGFQMEGVLRQHHYSNGSFHDVMIMGITRQEWLTKKAT